MPPPVVRPHADPWRDLVYHTLAHLPVVPTDASSLYNERYIRWAATRLPRPADPRRTLVKDAAQLAALYDAAPTAHRLQGFAALHRDLDAFEGCAQFALSEGAWPEVQEADGVRTLAAELSPELVELFRIALWGELRAGYTALHDGLRDAHGAAAATLAESLARLQARLPGLGDVDWCLSWALCRAGRLDASPRRQRRRITVGVPEPALRVPPWAPLLQGVHEYLLSEVHAELWATEPTAPAPAPSTRPDHRGFGDFFGPELLTLCLDCRALAVGTTAEPLRQWLRWYYPAGEADLGPQLAAARIPTGQPCGAGPDAFLTWLATGAVLPPWLGGPFEAISERLGVSSRPNG